MSFVLDASISLCWFLADGKEADVVYADSVLGALGDAQATVPAHWGLEVANVIAKCEARGVVTEARSQAFVALLDRLDIVVDQATHGVRWTRRSNSRGGTDFLPTMPLISSWRCAKAHRWQRWTSNCRTPPGLRAYRS